MGLRSRRPMLRTILLACISLLSEQCHGEVTGWGHPPSFRSTRVASTNVQGQLDNRRANETLRGGALDDDDDDLEINFDGQDDYSSKPGVVEDRLSSGEGKEVLYDAYNQLHTLAQVSVTASYLLCPVAFIV